MPANSLLTNSVVRLKEGVVDQIFNFRPSDAPLVSMIERESTSTEFVEWTADTYRAPSATNAAIEGADVSYAVQAQPTQFSNRHQIIQDTMSVSNTAEKVGKYGRKSEIDRLATKKMVELKRDIEAAAIANGTAVTRTGVLAGQMRGLFGFIATNNSLGATGAAPNPVTNTAPTAGTLRPLTEALVKTVITSVYQNGGDAEAILCSPSHRVTVSTFTGNVTRFNEVTRGQQNTLQTSFQFYGHEFGVTKIVPNRVMSGAGAGLINTLYIVDSDKIALGQLRPFEREQMATIGDAKNWQIRTEVTLLVKQESTLGAVRDLNP